MHLLQFSQRTWPKYAISHWIWICTLGNPMVCLYAAFFPVIQFCTYIFYFFSRWWMVERERREKGQPGGKKVDASVKTPLLSLWYCELFQANFHLQYQFGLILPLVCRERSLLTKWLFWNNKNLHLEPGAWLMQTINPRKAYRKKRLLCLAMLRNLPGSVAVCFHPSADQTLQN